MNLTSRLPLGAIVLVCLLGASFLLLRPTAEVQIILPDKEGRLVDSVMARPGDRVRLEYIHSVERTPVQGWFSIAQDGGFRAVKTKTTGMGTGLPNVVPDQRVSTQGRWLVIDEEGTHIPEIPFYYLPLNRLRILVGDRSMQLDGVPAGSRLRITSEVRPAWRWLASRLLSLVP